MNLACSDATPGLSVPLCRGQGAETQQSRMRRMCQEGDGRRAAWRALVWSVKFLSPLVRYDHRLRSQSKVNRYVNAKLIPKLKEDRPSPR